MIYNRFKTGILYFTMNFASMKINKMKPGKKTSMGDRIRISCIVTLMYG